MSELREISFDVETTGLDPRKGDRIVEIGCVELINRSKTGNHFHCYLDPQCDISAEAVRVHGLTKEFLTGKPLFTDVMNDFLEFISDSHLIIHNAAFDMKFLNAELQLAKQEIVDKKRAVDTLIMARKKFPGAPATLDALCKRFSIDLSSRSKHGALLDADLLASVYIELTGGGQSSLNLESVNHSPTVSSNHTNQTQHYPCRNFQANAQELERHKQLLEKITQPVWQ